MRAFVALAFLLVSPGALAAVAPKAPEKGSAGKNSATVREPSQRSTVPAGKADPGAKGSAHRPVRITATTFEALPGDRQVLWKGNVLAVQDDLRLTCDRLTADYDEEKRLKKLTCSGNAHMRQAASPPLHEEREAWGALAVYDNSVGLLTVTGAPHGREGANRMKGDVVLFDTRLDRLRAEGHVESWLEVPAKNNPLAPAGAREPGR